MNWVPLATAPDQLVAELWSGVLQAAGIPAMIRAGDTSSFLGVSAYPCRILVDETRLADAQAVLKSELDVVFDDDEGPE